MSWSEHYFKQSAVWGREAHAWATHGKESHAKRCQDIADMYGELAVEEAEHELRMERHRLLRVLKKVVEVRGQV